MAAPRNLQGIVGISLFVNRPLSRRMDARRGADLRLLRPHRSAGVRSTGRCCVMRSGRPNEMRSAVVLLRRPLPMRAPGSACRSRSSFKTSVCSSAQVHESRVQNPADSPTVRQIGIHEN